MTQSVDFEAFRQEWLEDIVEGNPSTVELGSRFSRKLITQWLGVDESSDDIVYCDGSGDGGIDIAYLNRGESSDEGSEEGDTWYLVQSKYGTAFRSSGTLLEESQKVIDTLFEIVLEIFTNFTNIWIVMLQCSYGESLS